MALLLAVAQETLEDPAAKVLIPSGSCTRSLLQESNSFARSAPLLSLQIDKKTGCRHTFRHWPCIFASVVPCFLCLPGRLRPFLALQGNHAALLCDFRFFDREWPFDIQCSGKTLFIQRVRPYIDHIENARQLCSASEELCSPWHLQLLFFEASTAVWDEI